MRELSVTVTVGKGDERHNHDLDYRSTLEHVHKCENGVIELIDYKSYKEQINELVRPYIDEYNAAVDKRWNAAWDRYHSGQIKTKPRKRDYKKIDYDYYSEHLNDTFYNPHTEKDEIMPMWRSVIVGIGDQEDRKSGEITEEEAVSIFTDVVEQFKKDFPYFKLLGATIHVDEAGFYHAHIDYKPFYENRIGQGLEFGIGQESALEKMGFEPEQSIINARDKAPLLFNAFRNKVYHIFETSMDEHGIRLQYGVSKKKDPEKDSSKNQKLKDWQDTQDKVRAMQHSKNIALDIIKNDDITPENIKEIFDIKQESEKLLEEINKAPRSKLNKDNVVVHFGLFDQLKSFINHWVESFSRIFALADKYGKWIDDLENQLSQSKEECEKLRSERDSLKEENSNLYKDNVILKSNNSKLNQKNKSMEKFMGKFNSDNKNLYELYQDQEERKIKEYKK